MIENNHSMSKLLLFQVQTIRNIFFGLGFTIVALFSCTVKPGEQNNSKSEPLPAEPNRVEVMVLERGDFYREIVSNGKLAAIQKAELWFKSQGIIESVNTGNGKSVPEGFEIARLQKDDFRFNLKKAELAMEKAEIDRLDALISMGYKSAKAQIPADHLKIANIRSGYNQAKIQLEEAEYELQNAVLKAPFSGKMEGLQQKPFEKADISKPFCTLINDSRFTIEFPLLETEVNQVQTGQEVTITPVAGAKQSTGTVTEINPRIDENGLAWLKAEVNNPGGYMEGMNVKVSIKKAIQNRLVVPKQAVVLRQNREVLFRYTGGTAYWTYVEVLDENESQYAVVAAEDATLEPGDTIITSNNLNLAHESEVDIE
jgi:RND family efflux transporter MFP subunit